MRVRCQATAGIWRVRTVNRATESHLRAWVFPVVGSAITHSLEPRSSFCGRVTFGTYFE